MTSTQTWVSAAVAVLEKEIRSEWRTRVAVAAVVLFAVGSLTLIGLSLLGAPSVSPQVVAGLLWILILFTAATGLGRVFVQEEERGTGLALRLCAPGTAVWAGKFAANAVLLLGIAALTTPLLLVMLASRVANPLLLACIELLGVLGIAAVFTLTAALVAQSSARGGLLAALSFPVLVPLLMGVVHGTQAAMAVSVAVATTAAQWTAGLHDMQILVSFDVIAITASLMLFDYVWSD